MGKDLKKILSIETSGKTLSLALIQAQNRAVKVLGEIFLDAGYRHSEVLSEACQFLVRGSGFKAQDLTHIAVSTGPGSFTGLRVGIAYARTLSQFLKIPLIGLPAFSLIARRAQETLPASIQWYCVLIESIGEDVYLGIFRKGSLNPAEPYCVISKKALGRKLAKLKRKKVLFSFEHPPRARDLGTIASQAAAKTSVSNRQKVVPFYLRAPIAAERAEYRKRK